MRRRGAALAFAFAFAFATGCATLIDLRDDYHEGAPAGSASDGAPAPAPAIDAATGEGGAGVDGGDVLDAAPSHAFGDAASWTTLTVPAATTGGLGFSGAASDGHYLYFAPSRTDLGYAGAVARYDLTAALTAPGSWASFDVATVASAAKGFSGAAFDGRYLYLSPDADVAPHGNVARYDTSAAFDEARSWEVFDLDAAGADAGISGALRGYVGVVFDGQYMYFAPFASGSSGQAVSAFHGRVARFDTRGPLASWSSWSVFDLGDLDVRAAGYRGALFDGRYVYFVPSLSPALVARYDTTLPFGSPGAWSTFALAVVASGAVGFHGAVFDGRYLYLVPARVPNTAAYSSVTVRYDTAQPFDVATSWKALDLAALGPSVRGYLGGAFDGRDVYFSPFYSGAPFVRYDTQADFADSDGGAWSTLATGSLTPVARIFGATAFDGRFVYYAPGEDTPYFARFDARAAPWIPPRPIQWSSFY